MSWRRLGERRRCADRLDAPDYLISIQTISDRNRSVSLASLLFSIRKLNLRLPRAARWAFVAFLFSETSMASNDTDLKSKLKELRTATDIVLMIVPYRTSFRTRVDENELPEVSCVYELTSTRGPTFDEVLETVDGLVTQHDEPKPVVDLRVGIIFRRDARVVHEFYFNDLGGHGNLNGFSGDRRISASPNLPERLRALVTHQDVILTRNRHSRCPHELR